MHARPAEIHEGPSWCRGPDGGGAPSANHTVDVVSVMPLEIGARGSARAFRGYPRRRLESRGAGTRNPGTKPETNSYKTGRGRETKCFAAGLRRKERSGGGRFKPVPIISRKRGQRRGTGRAESWVRDNISATPRSRRAKGEPRDRRRASGGLRGE